VHDLWHIRWTSFLIAVTLQKDRKIVAPKYMKHYHIRKAEVRPLVQKLSAVYVYYCVHQSPPLVSILSRINSLYALTPSLRSVLILPSSSHAVTLGFLTKTLNDFLFHSCYVPQHNFITLLEYDDECKQ